MLKVFKPEFAKNATLPEKSTTAEQNTLRILIGILGLFLPFSLWFGLYLFSHHDRPLPSISHYYFTRVNTLFTVVIGVLALVLLLYKGKKLIDFILSGTAGAFALSVIFFPTTNLTTKCSKNIDYAITYVEPDAFRETFHFISAGIFLCSLAVMSIYRFPKDDSSNEQPSSLDKFMYRLCGMVMLLALLVVFLGHQDIFFPKKYFNAPYSGTFWGETIAVWAFGYSWLLKAGFFGKIYRHLLS